jgi:hypothetical protein
MKRLVLSVVVAVAALGFAGCGSNTYGATLLPKNGAQQLGFLTITDNGHDVLVFQVTMDNVAAGASQPSHIHVGRCADLSPGPIDQNLQAIVNPTNAVASITLSTPVNAKYSDLHFKAYVDVHESFLVPTVVACGDLN